MIKKISQREARLLRKKVKEQEHFLLGPYAGALIETLNLSDVSYARLKTAETLGYALLLRFGYQPNEVKIRAVKP